MRGSWKLIILVLAFGILGVVCSSATEVELLNYHESPREIWRAFGSNGFRQGNGVFMSPNDDMLVGASEDGSLIAFDPLSGERMWTYRPSNLGFPPEDFPVQSYSGVTFSYNNKNDDGEEDDEASKNYLVSYIYIYLFRAHWVLCY